MRDSLRKYLAAATLLVLPVIAACGEDVMPPPPTGSIVGQVSIEGMGVDGVSVSLSNGASTATAGGGNYRFDNVEQGSYTITISGFPADASFDATSAPASIGDTGGTVTVDFRGTYIRTAAIMGTVTVENMGLGGITVRLSGMANAEMTTDNSGGYKFDALRGGTYSVEISGFEAGEVSFSSTSGAATVGVGETKVVSFDGTYVRTAGVQGQVSVDGEGLEGVTVTLKGDDVDRTEITNAAGQYAFSMLKSGTYQVGIINPDPEDYEFETTSKTATIATGETANVPFEGTLLRTAGIAGRVSVEGMGLDGVTVTLAGAADTATETANGGQYSFAGLAAGTYVLTITNPDPVAYDFAEEDMTENVVLADDQSAIVNFEGTHTRTAQISGMLYIDEAPQDTMYNDGEPSIVEALAPLLPTLSEEARAMVMGLLAKAKVSLRGPDLNTVVPVDINADGSFSTGESLMAGTYQLELPVNDEAVAGALKAAGVAFVGGSMVRTVAAGGMATANFPFRITMQTVNVEAVMGRAAEEEIPADRARVEKVKLKVYANADGTVMLDEGETDAMGMASFTFARDANTGPAGNDNIVFVKAESPSDALAITDNAFVEVAYDGTERVSNAGAAVRFVNVAVNFDFWVKSIMARNGDMGLGGWAVQYCTPMADNPETEEKDPVVCEGKDAGFMAITTGGGEDEEPEPVVSDTTTAMENMNLGKVSFSKTLTAEMLAKGPVPFHVRVTPVTVAEDGTRKDVQKGVAGGEMWEASTLDAYEHTGLDLPPGKDDDPTDLGPIRIEFKTQSLTVGVYRETDDQPGFTDYRSDYPGGDHRPHTTGIEVELMYSEGGGRLKRYDYMTFDAKGKRTVEAANPKDVPKWSAKSQAGGMVTFKHLPADVDFTVRLRAGSGRTAVGDRDVDAYGDALDDMSNGSFGGAGGALPEVRLCPLTTTSRPDFLGPTSDDCATFAYQWTTGTVTTTLTGLRKDVTATLTLDPVTDVHSEGDDKDFKGNATGGPQEYSFSGVQDGVYRVVLTGGDVKEKKSGELEIYHNESAADPDDAPDTDAWTVSATSVRGMIKGVVANNRIGVSDYTISSDEAGVGVELGLFEVKETTGKPDAPGAAVTDDDGNAVTVTTNAEGEYVFENLADGDEYFVKVLDCGDNCEAYHSIDTDDHSFIAYAQGEAKVYADDAKNKLPKWNHDAAAVTGIIANATDGGFLDFAMLYRDGTLAGEVSEPFGEVDNHDIELTRCLTYQPFDAGTDPIDTSDDTAEGCAIYDDSFEDEVETDEDGQWSKGSLREGFYEVTVNPKGGYRIYDEAKDADPQEPYDAVKTVFAKLEDGSTASDEVPNVQIVNGRLGRGTTVGAVQITANGITYTNDGGGTATSIPAGATPLYHIVKTVTVAPQGTATRFKVSATATGAVTAANTTGALSVSPPPSSTRGYAPTTTFTVTLNDGTGATDGNLISVTAVAENGYGTGTPVAVAEVSRTPVQTAATVTSVTVGYNNANGTPATETVTTGANGINFVASAFAADVSGSFTLTFNLGDGADWATLEYREGTSGSFTAIAIPDYSGGADEDAKVALRAARKSGSITVPAKGGNRDFQVKVTSQDGDTTGFYTIRVSRAAS